MHPMAVMHELHVGYTKHYQFIFFGIVLTLLVESESCDHQVRSSDSGLEDHSQKILLGFF